MMSAPIRHTCPDIDKAIKQIISARIALKDAKDSDDIEDKDYAIGCADDELDGIGDMLEDLRSSNDALRSWGHDLEKQIEDLEAHLQDLQNQF